jgi:hypothetical protein
MEAREEVPMFESAAVTSFTAAALDLQSSLRLVAGTCEARLLHSAEAAFTHFAGC